MKIKEMLLSINPMIRPGEKLACVKNIILHSVSNYNTSSIANRNYLECLANQSTTHCSVHYIIGINGEVIRCIPENEIAWHAGDLNINFESIGIEICFSDSNGVFCKEAINSLVVLMADICKRYNLDPIKSIIRHYDISKDDCPKYYVLHQDEFEKIKAEVLKRIKKRMS
ncbi:MAG: peptidoglycan recognition family protein [Clostridia bacterium]